MSRRAEWILITAVMVVSFSLRLLESSLTYLNPDEVQYYFLSSPDSWRALFLSSSQQTDHPPLLFLLMHPIVSITSWEPLLRLIPILCAVFFPWVIYRWLAIAWSASAGIAAFLILSLSPNLIALSAQVRGYMPAMLFAALALLFLEQSLKSNSVWKMLLFTLFLYLGILTEYNVAWFAGAVGLYVLLRIREDRRPASFLITWVLGQVGALLIYADLYVNALRPRASITKFAMEDFMSFLLPQPGQNLAAFSVAGFVKQFAYVFSSVGLGFVGAALFLLAIAVLWTGWRSPSGHKNPKLACLLLCPFVLVTAASIMRFYPYARSRHTVILALFVAIGAGIALAALLETRPKTAMLAALGFGLVWFLTGEADSGNIARKRHYYRSLASGLAYVQSAIPPGSVVLGDLEGESLIAYYLPVVQQLFPQEHVEEPFHLVARRYAFLDTQALLADIAWAREQSHLGPDQPLWIVDAGWDNRAVDLLRTKFPGIILPGLRDFDGAITVFQLPPRF